MDEFLQTNLDIVQKTNEQTPSRANSKFTSIPKSPYERPNASRGLFQDVEPTSESKATVSKATESPKKRRSFKLVDIYERLHNCPPEIAHNAEADTIHLLKCAIAIKENFVKLADSTAKKFNDI